MAPHHIDEDTATHVLEGWLAADLEVVTETGRGTWQTCSNLPHEIRVHTQAGVHYVRVSAGMLMGVDESEGLLAHLNLLNAERAATRRIVGGGNVLVVGELPIRSLGPGDLEQLVAMVLSFARLDAEDLSFHGGRPTTVPPAHLVPDLERPLHDWADVLRASRTATHAELNTWLDEWGGIECWLDRDDESLTVVLSCMGISSSYPFCLLDLKESMEDLVIQAAEMDDE